QTVAEDCQTAVHATAAGARGRGFVMIGPEYTASGGVECYYVVGSLHGVEHAIDDERRGFKFFEGFGLPYPLQFEIFRVRSGDLVERAVPLIVKRARVAKPVFR